MDQFKAVLLVDDDEATNFFHRIILEDWGRAGSIYSATNGARALDFLRTSTDFRSERPSLILLDVNMPVMNGFEFLEAYHDLDDELKASVVVVMLTSSLHALDRGRAEEFVELGGYINKPLTAEQLDAVLATARLAA